MVSRALGLTASSGFGKSGSVHKCAFLSLIASICEFVCLLLCTGVAMLGTLPDETDRICAEEAYCCSSCHGHFCVQVPH